MIPSIGYPAIPASSTGIKGSPFRSNMIISIATDLSQSKNPMPLLEFLSQQDVEEFKHPTLQEILISSFSKAHTPASPLYHELFWDLAKRIICSFCQNPHDLKILVEGGCVGDINLFPLLSLHNPAMLFILFQDILFLVQASAPPESIEIITAVKEKSRRAIFSKIWKESLSPGSPGLGSVLEKRSPSPIGPISSPSPLLRTK
jgi:hypothetical protein